MTRFMIDAQLPGIAIEECGHSGHSFVGSKVSSIIQSLCGQQHNLTRKWPGDSTRTGRAETVQMSYDNVGLPNVRRNVEAAAKPENCRLSWYGRLRQRLEFRKGHRLAFRDRHRLRFCRWNRVLENDLRFGKPDTIDRRTIVV